VSGRKKQKKNNEQCPIPCKYWKCGNFLGTGARLHNRKLMLDTTNLQKIFLSTLQLLHTPNPSPEAFGCYLKFLIKINLKNTETR
jgi:hypothetical protein